MSENDNTGGGATAAETTKKFPDCSKCGSDAVVRDAWASWNADTQTWQLKQVFDHTFCPVCEEETKLEWNSPAETTKQKICRLNDDLRKCQGVNGEIILTSGIHGHGQEFVAEVARAVAGFDDFTPDNDPHHEHDFGSLELRGQKIFFKIDYYDLSMKMLSPDLSDPAVTKRVLTIMLAEEY